MSLILDDAARITTALSGAGAPSASESRIDRAGMRDYTESQSTGRERRQKGEKGIMKAKLQVPVTGSRSTAMLCIASVSFVASAHHSTSHYVEEFTELEGELVEVAWTNPHAGLTMRTTDPAGQMQIWDLELPGGLYGHSRRGITQDLFHPGDRVTVAGHTSRRYEQRLLTTNILLDDGREVLIRERAGSRFDTELFSRAEQVTQDDLLQRARAENRGLFRVWSPSLQNNLLGAQAEPPFREEAIAARAAWDPEDNFVMRCEPPGMPDSLQSPYPIEFINHGSTVELRAVGNYNVVARTIHMDDSADPAEQAPSPTGYSVGRWEGNSLVVETSRIDWPYFDNIGTPQSDAVETVERFELSEDQSTLGYEMSVTDLGVFTRPAVITADKTYLALGESMPEQSTCRY